MAERRASGVLHTRVYIDIAELDPGLLPEAPDITAITMAELHYGISTAKDALTRAARIERLGAAIVEFEPLPFDAAAAARYGSLVPLVRQAKRDPRPRRLDLMIAATASANGLPLYTRNAADFRGLLAMVEVISV